MLELDQVTLFRQQRQVLGPLSLSLKSGQFCAVLGANGAGKSSLLSLLSGLDAPASGRLSFAFANGRHTIRQLAQHRALMPQFHALGFDFSVREVVMLGRTPHHGMCDAKDHRKLTDKALALSGMLDFSGRRYTRLSGGQQARVQFARALAQLNCGEGGDKLLLLDEPTASLDLRYQLLIMKCIRQLCDAGLCCVAVLHDINLAAQFADLIVLLDQGKAAAVGAPSETLTEPLLSRVFQLPVRVLDNVFPDRPMIAMP
ncbi:heme ABC transporter ATP-binding protein [Litorivivens sp.]|uniref:heme ABC transporter ATP-binding protein n=1 Tax=Litorivivens sp. TaxID=2020868 RepID=UPI0035659ABE